MTPPDPPEPLAIPYTENAGAWLPEVMRDAEGWWCARVRRNGSRETFEAYVELGGGHYFGTGGRVATWRDRFWAARAAKAEAKRRNRIASTPNLSDWQHA